MQHIAFKVWLFFVIIQFTGAATVETTFSYKKAKSEQLEKSKSESHSEMPCLIKETLQKHTQVVRFQLVDPIFYLLYKIEVFFKPTLPFKESLAPVNIFLRVLLSRIVPNNAP